MIETQTDRKTLKKEIGHLVANGIQHPYPNSFFEQPRLIIREIIADQDITHDHPFRQKIGHNLSVLIAKSRQKEPSVSLRPTIQRLLLYL